MKDRQLKVNLDDPIHPANFNFGNMVQPVPMKTKEQLRKERREYYSRLLTGELEKGHEVRARERQTTGYFAQHTYDDDDEPIVLDDQDPDQDQD